MIELQKKSASVYLNDFEVVLPAHQLPQQEILDWTSRNHAKTSTAGELDLPRFFNRYAVQPKQISKRYFECSDILNSETNGARIYDVSPNNDHGADINSRTHFFSEKAATVFNTIYADKNEKPDHIVHVTCTGYASPSAAQKIVIEPFWKKSTAVTHAYHMGCYAAMPAIRMAQGIVFFEGQADRLFKTDIVHTEMCGLHMNPSDHSPEQLVVQSLFADGHIKYSVTAEPQGAGPNLKVLAIHEKVIPESTGDMSWVPASWGMQMTLSRDVPQKIKSEIKLFLNELVKKTDLQVLEVMNSIFAIHPGGPKIIDAVQEVLELSDAQTAQSKKVLYERGNMSSATLPHVWVEILKNPVAAGTKIISFAFGPGLTLFGSVFEVC